MGFVIVSLLLLLLRENTEEGELLCRIAVLRVIHDFDFLVAAFGHCPMQVAFIVIEVLYCCRIVCVLKDL